MDRRTFLKMTGLSLLGSILLPRLARRAEAQQEQPTYWIGTRYFVQDTVDTSDLPERIWARIDGQWHVFPVRRLPMEFLNWDFEARLQRLEDILNGQMPSHYDGPHNAAVATYSRFGRGDSEFIVNNAVKGMGFVPKRERIHDVIDRLKSSQGDSLFERVQLLIDLYSDRSIWDQTKQGSLELYTSSAFETHTFRNQMRNPISTVVFLDIPSYELRTVARLLHPNNPNLTDYESSMAEYINTVHSFFHTGPTNFIACIYYVIEVFDNSPGTERPGTRIVPPIAQRIPRRSARASNHLNRIW